MKRYNVIEMGAFAAVAATLLIVFPESELAVILAVGVTYGLLQVASALAFCIAIRKGLVQEHGPAPYRYSVKPEGRTDWLVMRHIWTYLRLETATRT